MVSHSPRQNHIKLNLLFISFLGLFAELLLIRWLPLRIRLLAYFSNLILLSALLGLGLGMAMAHQSKTRLIKHLPLLLATLTFIVVFTALIPDFVLPLADKSYFVWNGLSRMKSSFTFISYGILILILGLNTWLFISLGHEIGLLFNKLKPIPAYTINILGSILGVLGFSLLSAFSFPPVIWFCLFITGYVYYLKQAKFNLDFTALKRVVIPFTVTIVLVYISTLSPNSTYLWSPYYEIQTQDIKLNNQKVGFGVWVNQDSHQQTLDLSGKFAYPLLQSRKKIYELPYQLINPPVTRVLVLGAGTGNDVAAALRMGARHVDAVEIDPLIAKLGQNHPEKPYSDPRVSLIIDDAKAFLERTENQYDVITFGFLDSHRLFSSMSSVRLENYMYTLETMNKVKSLLKPQGVVAITYTVHEKWIADRIYSLLWQTFGRQPLVYQGDHDGWGTVFLASNSTLNNQSEANMIDNQFTQFLQSQPNASTWGYGDVSGWLSDKMFSSQAIVPTDDWPHLFLESPRIPNNYLIVLTLLMGLTILAVKQLLSFKSLSRVSNWNFFFLGAAFALLETKGVTELAVVIGTTWITNSAVIVAVLLMILIANLLVLRISPISKNIIYVLLIIAVLLNYFVPLIKFLDLSWNARLLVGSTQIALPLLFSGILFALFFKNTRDASTALGMNLIGAVLGGLLEYTSLIWGHRILFLLALGFYLASFVLWRFPHLWSVKRDQPSFT